MQRIVVIDTETGGLDPQNSSLLTVAAVLVNEAGEITDSKEWCVLEEPLVVHKGAMQTNKIDLMEFYGKAKPPLTVLMELDAFIKDWRVENHRAIPCGHNVKFDLGYLKRLELLASSKQDPRDGWLAIGWQNRALTYHSMDTASLMRALHLAGLTEGYLTSLSHCCEYFGIPLGDDAHGALADATACAKLLVAGVKMLRGEV